MLLRHLVISLMLLASVATAETNTTQTHRIEVVVTVAGMQETADSIQQTSQQVAALTRRLSEKKEFTSEEHQLIAELTNALNNHAVAVNNIANALPKQLEEIQGSAISILDHATGNVQQVVTTSKTGLVDPTLDRIQTQVLVFIVLLGVVLIGVIWFGLWQIRSIVATGSETISNITQTMKSVEKVVERVNRSEEHSGSN